jgi:hypothetical protein
MRVSFPIFWVSIGGMSILLAELHSDYVLSFTTSLPMSSKSTSKSFTFHMRRSQQDGPLLSLSTSATPSKQATIDAVHASRRQALGSAMMSSGILLWSMNPSPSNAAATKVWYLSRDVPFHDLVW